MLTRNSYVTLYNTLLICCIKLQKRENYILKLKYWILILVLLVSLIVFGIKFLMNSELGNSIILKDYEEVQINMDQLDLIIHAKQASNMRIQQLIDTLPAIQKEQQKILPDASIKGKLNVYIIEQDATYLTFFKKTKDYENVAFYSLDTESIYLSGDLDNVSNPFVHEYMHYLMHQYTKSINVDMNDLPDWFVEGVANSFEVIVSNDIPENIGVFEATPFHDLKKLKDENRNAIYGQGMYGVIALMERQGASVIQNILSALKKTTFNKAFSEVTSIDLTTYHTEFEQDSVSEMLKTLDDQLYTNPQKVIEKAETLLAQHGEINIFGTSLFELLFEAHLSLNHENESIYYATLLMDKIENPLLLISYAKRISSFSETLADEILEVSLSKATSPEEENRLKEYAQDLFAQ